MLWEGLGTATRKSWALQCQAQEGGEKNGILVQDKSYDQVCQGGMYRAFSEDKEYYSRLTEQTFHAAKLLKGQKCVFKAEIQ